MLSHSLGLRARVLQVRVPVANFCSSSSPSDPFSPDRIFSDDSREGCVLRLQQFKSDRGQPPSGEGVKQAAVLVPLCTVGGEVSLLYTLRSPSLTSHRGQVSFPGGMKDPSDENSVATALRETEEELGIPSQKIEIWGSCNPLSARISGVSVVPVVGSLGVLDFERLKVNEQEVTEVFTIPVHQLCSIENFKHTQFRNGYIIPVYLGGKHRVWGLTAGITHIVLSSLLPSVYKRKLIPIKPIQNLS